MKITYLPKNQAHSRDIPVVNVPDFLDATSDLARSNIGSTIGVGFVEVQYRRFILMSKVIPFVGVKQM